jgi:hypothetical protein
VIRHDKYQSSAHLDGANMSHVATTWLATIPPSDLTHGEFRVLFHLCDCHNPSAGCFPKQTYLMKVSGLSESGLNRALASLAEKGILERVRSRDPRTNRQKPTRYILGFEMEKPQEPTPLSGVGNSGADSTGVESGRLHGGGAYIDEPVKEEPVREEEERACARAETFDDFFGQLLLICGYSPNEDLPVWWHGDGARAHVSRWCGSLGLSHDRVLAVARKFRAEKPERPMGPKALDRAMEREARASVKSSKSKSAAPATGDAIANFWAEWINSDRYIPPNAIPRRLIDLVVERGLVTRDRLVQRGLVP